MNATDTGAVVEVRRHLIEIGGAVAQDFGLGRVVGQVLTYLYLRDCPCSLDDLVADLGLSKAAVSISARQLETLGMVRRVWQPGDRRLYYRTADNIAVALREGLLTLLRQKLQAVHGELNAAAGMLPPGDVDKDLVFMRSRVERMRTLTGRMERLLGSPLLKLLTK